MKTCSMCRGEVRYASFGLLSHICDACIPQYAYEAAENMLLFLYEKGASEHVLAGQIERVMHWKLLLDSRNA